MLVSSNEEKKKMKSRRRSSSSAPSSESDSERARRASPAAYSKKKRGRSESSDPGAGPSDTTRSSTSSLVSPRARPPSAHSQPRSRLDRYDRHDHSDLASDTSRSKHDQSESKRDRSTATDGVESRQGSRFDGRSDRSRSKYDEYKSKYDRPDSRLGRAKSRYDNERPNSKYDRPDSRYGRAESRDNYERPESRYERPNSKYDRPDSRYGRAESRYERPNSKYDRPDSRYGRAESRYERPISKYDRPDSRYGRAESRDDYERPQSRSGHFRRDRSRSNHGPSRSRDMRATSLRRHGSYAPDTAESGGGRRRGADSEGSARADPAEEEEMRHQAAREVLRELEEVVTRLMADAGATDEERKRVLIRVFEAVRGRMRGLRAPWPGALVLQYRVARAREHDEAELAELLEEVVAARKAQDTEEGEADADDELDQILQDLDLALFDEDIKPKIEALEVGDSNEGASWVPVPAGARVFRMRDRRCGLSVCVTVPAQRTNRFFLVIKKLLRQMKERMLAHCAHIQLELFQYVMRLRLEETIADLLKDEERMKAKAVVELYRKTYPEEKDDELLLEALCAVWRGEYNDSDDNNKPTVDVDTIKKEKDDAEVPDLDIVKQEKDAQMPVVDTSQETNEGRQLPAVTIKQEKLDDAEVPNLDIGKPEITNMDTSIPQTEQGVFNLVNIKQERASLEPDAVMADPGTFDHGVLNQDVVMKDNNSEEKISHVQVKQEN